MLLKFLLLTWIMALGADVVKSARLVHYWWNLWGKAKHNLQMARGMAIAFLGNVIEDVGIAVMLLLPPQQKPSLNKVGLIIWLVLRIHKTLALIPAVTAIEGKNNHK